jgi:signal peptidase II
VRRLASRLLWGPWSRLGLTVAAATVVADQLDKLWMFKVRGLREGVRVHVLPFLDYVLVYNKGISYGLGAGHFGQQALAAFAFFAALALAIWLARGEMNRVLAVSIGLIVGGAVANGIDRLHFGGVADFYSLHAFGYYWYVFNVADVAIVAGVAGLLYDSFVANREDASKRV